MSVCDFLHFVFKHKIMPQLHISGPDDIAEDLKQYNYVVFFIQKIWFMDITGMNYPATNSGVTCLHLAYLIASGVLKYTLRQDCRVIEALLVSCADII